ncbi:MAG: hypothetical protein K2X93_19370 [Candidatus Obscuribacterales bacterium]|nr:hypothetical protein [Candidatus Obscuribacterales bacterium]
MAEFGPVVCLFFLFIVFPFVDLMFVATGFATTLLLTQDMAHSASKATSVQDAYSYLSDYVGIEKARGTIEESDLLKFARAKFVGGSGGIFIERTSIVSGKTDHIGPNQSATDQANASDYVYEYMVGFEVIQEPFIVCPLPGLDKIPGIGKPFRYVQCARGVIENPEGIYLGKNRPTWLSSGMLPMVPWKPGVAQMKF